MSELRLEPAALPDKIAVGDGTALFVSGSMSGPDARSVRKLALADGDRIYPVIGHGLRPRRGGGRSDPLWWGLMPFAPVGEPRRPSLRAIAELRNGETVELELGEVELLAGLSDVYTSELRAVRRRAAAAVREQRSARGGPIVAVAMATHCPPRALFERQLASLRAQTDDRWICVISDDGSPDDSLAEIREVIGDDSRFVLWPSSDRRGTTGNFERALAMVPDNVRLVALADQTDYWYPHKLEVLCPLVRDDVWLAYADLRVMSAGGEVRAAHWCDPRRAGENEIGSLLLSNYVPGGNSVVRREALDLALPFPPRADAGRYDQWLAAVALTRGEIAFEPALLADHHVDGPDSPPDPEEPGSARPARWNERYFHAHARMLVAAAVLAIRAGEQLGPQRRAELESILSLDGGRSARLRVTAARNRLSRHPAARERGRVLRAIARTRARTNGGLPPLGAIASVPTLARSDAVPGAPEGPTSGRDPDHPAAGGNGRPQRSRGAEAPLSIDVHELRKTFQLPEPPPDRLLQRARHPLRSFRHGSLTVLDGISFQVERGELFGILGRNGSGKSTLLRILAGIYGYDSGRVRVARRIAPVIELGVGLQAEFAALQNVILNAELMGISEAQARRRFDSIIEFAGLEDFVDLKLRNYSSGMRARLAFSIAIQVDADVLLLDEVLAVGDPAFQRKCEGIFEDRRADRETTIVLVTQQPAKTQRFCDRAMLLEGGRIECIGDPADVARRYAEVTLEGRGSNVAGPHTTLSNELARFSDLWLEDESGERALSVHAGEHLRLHATIDTSAPVEEPGLRLEIRNRANAKIFAPPTLRFDLHPGLEHGQRIEVETGIENKLAPGPYTVVCTLCGLADGVERAVSRATTVEFVVVGGPSPTEGVIDLDHTLRVSAAAPGSGEAV